MSGIKIVGDGGVTLKIMEPSGEPIAACEVKITSACGLVITLRTDAAGIARAPFLVVEYGEPQADPKMIPAAVGIARHFEQK